MDRIPNTSSSGEYRDRFGSTFSDTHPTDALSSCESHRISMETMPLENLDFQNSDTEHSLTYDYDISFSTSLQDEFLNCSSRVRPLSRFRRKSVRRSIESFARRRSSHGLVYEEDTIETLSMATGNTFYNRPFCSHHDPATVTLDLSNVVTPSLGAIETLENDSDMSGGELDTEYTEQLEIFHGNRLTSAEAQFKILISSPTKTLDTNSCFSQKNVIDSKSNAVLNTEKNETVEIFDDDSLIFEDPVDVMSLEEKCISNNLKRHVRKTRRLSSSVHAEFARRHRSLAVLKVFFLIPCYSS